MNITRKTYVLLTVVAVLIMGMFISPEPVSAIEVMGGMMMGAVMGMIGLELTLNLQLHLVQQMSSLQTKQAEEKNHIPTNGILTIIIQHLILIVLNKIHHTITIILVPTGLS
jgi:hypothetical protein